MFYPAELLCCLSAKFSASIDSVAERLTVEFQKAAKSLELMLQRCPWLKGEYIPRNVYSIIQRLENDSQLQELWDIPKHLTENEITKLNKIDEEYWEDKENIMRLMLLKFHSDSVENIDNEA